MSNNGYQLEALSLRSPNISFPPVAVSITSVVQAYLWQFTTAFRVAYMRSICPSFNINVTLTWPDAPLLPGYMVRLAESGPRGVRGVRQVKRVCLNETASQLHNSIPPPPPQTLNGPWTFFDLEGSVSGTPNLLLDGVSDIPVAFLPVSMPVSVVSDA